MSTNIFSNDTTAAPYSLNHVKWKGTGPYSYPVSITSGNRRTIYIWTFRR